MRDDQIAREIGMNIDGDELDALYDTYDTRARNIGEAVSLHFFCSSKHGQFKFYVNHEL